MIRFLFAVAILGQLAAESLAQGIEPPPPAPREFRAAWVATVNNIDWPSRPGLSGRRAQRRELDDDSRSARRRCG